MKAFAILLCICMVSLLVSSLPIISKPLENNPDHLVWEALLTIDTHRSDDKTRKIPKSIFITPNLNESKGNCPPDHKLGPDGRCYKTLKIDPLVILKTQIESLLKKNRTATTEYDEDYDYSEYSESTESMSSNGQYTVPLSLGFGTDQRPIHLQQQQLQQQQQQQLTYTTFPNLNRVVKDDSHIASGLHVSSEKENQPFLVSTTGLGLDSEIDGNDDIEDDVTVDEAAFPIESKSETSASVATASSMVPSSSTAAAAAAAAAVNALETGLSSTANIGDDNSADTNPTSTLSSNAADTMAPVHASQPAQTTIVSTDTEEMTSKMASSVKTLVSDFEIESSESSTIIAHTEQDFMSEMAANTASSEHTATTNGYSSETFAINGKIAGTTPAIATTLPTDKIDTTQTDDVITMQSSTNIPSDLIELEHQHNESLPHQLPTLSQTIGKSIENQQNYEKYEINADDGIGSMETQFDHTNTEASALHSKADKRIDNMDDVPATLAPQTASFVPSSSTVVPFTDTSVATGESEANETNESDDKLIDTIFIPPQFVDTLADELDAAVGKPLDISADETSKYRNFENVSTTSAAAVVDDDAESSEAEIAPIIDTGKGPRANIELVDDLDESARQHSGENDEVKNLDARLADELLFLGIENDKQTPSPALLPLTPSPLVDNRKELFEEPVNSGVTLGSHTNNEMTTEESIDYDLDKVKIDRASDETSKNVEYDNVSPEKETVQSTFQLPSFVGTEKQTLEPPPISIVTQPQQLQPKPSIYSTFMNRLKYAPPIVDLSITNNNRPKYTHSPFDLASAIQNAHTDQRSSQQSYTDAAAATTVDDIVSNNQSPDDINLSSERNSNTGNQQQLQIGINCYLRNLVNKQQYIICDNA